jgi:hypothetical protein
MAGHCYRRSCEKAGTGHSSHLMVPKVATTITGNARFYERVAEICNMVRRGLCPNCGAAVLGERSGWPDTVTLWAGSLDDSELFRPA